MRCAFKYQKQREVPAHTCAFHKTTIPVAVQRGAKTPTTTCVRGAFNLRLGRLRARNVVHSAGGSDTTRADSFRQLRRRYLVATCATGQPISWLARTAARASLSAKPSRLVGH